MTKSLLLLLAAAFCVAGGAPAQESVKKSGHGGKAVVVVSHEVKDYAAWRKVFDAHEPTRKEMGFKVWGVYADVKNPNMVTVMGEFRDAAGAEAFFSSTELKARMQEGGVMGKPDIKVLTAKPK